MLDKWAPRNSPVRHWLTVRSLQELLETDLEVYAANGQPIPYDGWVELTVNLTGSDYPDLTVQTPFLVSQLSLSQPLLGANVLEQVIKRQESSGAAVATLLGLLRRAFGMEEEQVTAMVNYIQVPQKPFCDPATVRVGRDNTVIPAGKAVHVWCRVPLNFDTSDSLVLYEPAEEHPILGQLSVGAGLLEINHTQRPHIRVPISNHSKHEITLPKRTPLGVIQHVTKVLDTAESPRADTLTAVTAEVNHTTSPSVGDNPVYKVAPETGNRPTRTLHRNLLLQVNDLPVEPPPSSVTNPRESHKRTKRHSEPLKLTERTQSPDTSDSEEEDGVYRYWLRLPARTDRNSPGPDVIQEPQENIGQDQIQQEQRVDVESEQERESVIEEEQEVHSEAERDMDQLQPSDDQQPPEVVCLEEDIAGPLQPEHPAPLRHSSRVRRPGYMFTYPSLGQPAYLPRPTVGSTSTLGPTSNLRTTSSLGTTSFLGDHIHPGDHLLPGAHLHPRDHLHSRDNMGMSTDSRPAEHCGEGALLALLVSPPRVLQRRTASSRGSTALRACPAFRSLSLSSPSPRYTLLSPVSLSPSLSLSPSPFRLSPSSSHFILTPLLPTLPSTPLLSSPL
ncbi:hypothetical protein N1851_035225 [Merluccius polli]|uniref:Uncharacterized protein n=1 Tax=Merluccius polli TaxID=89951 RepID=A0AA47NLW9_MERPO|nr:hypothetical protein N1851_035225 [Merluccius polli]